MTKFNYNKIVELSNFINNLLLEMDKSINQVKRERKTNNFENSATIELNSIKASINSLESNISRQAIKI